MSALTGSRILTAAACVALLTSAMGAAQVHGSLSGPVLGYVFDPNAGSLRPVRGILGSATVGTPVDSGVTLSQVLTLDAVHAIASTDASPQLVVLSMNTGPSSNVTIPGIPANPTRAAASLRGTSAAFYYAGAEQVRIVAGLPKEPRYVAELQVDRPLTHMAVNDDGTLLVYAASGPDGEALYAWTASGGSPRFLTSAVSISGIAITRDGDAIVTDRGTNEVFAIWGASGGAVRGLLADVRDGVSNPMGVALSSLNRIYVANAGTDTAVVLDSSGHFLKAEQCSCTISGLYPLRDSVFRLTDGIGQTIFLLDASTAEERILFVPPPQE